MTVSAGSSVSELDVSIPVALSEGGTGAVLSDPNADRIFFWDDSAGSTAFLAPGTTLAITTTTIDVSTIVGVTQIVEAVLTTKNVSAAEARELYTNEGDADGSIINLPTAAAGLTYTIYVQAAQTITVNASTGDTLRLAGAVSASAGNITSNTVGSSVTLVAINATEWVATSIIGTWVVT